MLGRMCVVGMRSRSPRCAVACAWHLAIAAQFMCWAALVPLSSVVTELGPCAYYAQYAHLLLITPRYPLPANNGGLFSRPIATAMAIAIARRVGRQKRGTDLLRA